MSEGRLPGAPWSVSRAPCAASPVTERGPARLSARRLTWQRPPSPSSPSPRSSWPRWAARPGRRAGSAARSPASSWQRTRSSPVRSARSAVPGRRSAPVTDQSQLATGQSGRVYAKTPYLNRWLLWLNRSSTTNTRFGFLPGVHNLKSIAL